MTNPLILSSQSADMLMKHFDSAWKSGKSRTYAASKYLRFVISWESDKDNVHDYLRISFWLFDSKCHDVILSGQNFNLIEKSDGVLKLIAMSTNPYNDTVVSFQISDAI